MENLQQVQPIGCSKLLNTKQVMDYLGVGRNKAYEIMCQRDTGAFMLGGVWKISQKALDTWIDKQSQPRMKAVK